MDIINKDMNDIKTRDIKGNVTGSVQAQGDIIQGDIIFANKQLKPADRDEPKRNPDNLPRSSVKEAIAITVGCVP